MSPYESLTHEQLQKKIYIALDTEAIQVVREWMRRSINRDLERLEKQVKEVYDVARVQGQLSMLRKLDSFLSPPSHSGSSTGE